MTADVVAGDTVTFRTWSCAMRLVVQDPRNLASAAEDLVSTLHKVEQAASRFLPHSALSMANRRAGQPTPIPRLLVDLVSAALDAARDTDGLVDPTVGLALQNNGYDRDIADVADSPVPLVGVRPRRTWRDVRLHREAGLLTVPVGAALDLGATAKAYTADRAAKTLAGRYRCAVLVELGGDVALAGNHYTDWVIDVAERAGGAGQRVKFNAGGMATSTTTIRRWQRAGALAHHIVDPRTGLPANGRWRTATVHVESAYRANTASTAAIVLGEKAQPWLEKRGLAARLVDQSGDVAVTAGWPAPELIGAS